MKKIMFLGKLKNKIVIFRTICIFGIILAGLVSIIFVYLIHWISEFLVWLFYLFPVFILGLITWFFVLLALEAVEDGGGFIFIFLPTIFIGIFVGFLILVCGMHKNHKKLCRTARMLKEANR